MNKGCFKKIVLSASISCAALTVAASAHAQALYQPYYYTTREQYMVQNPLPVPTPAPAPSYAPDERLTPTTNQHLAQGSDYPKTEPRPKLVREPSTVAMGTLSGIEVGAQAYYYNFGYTNGGTRQFGGKIGPEATITAKFGDGYFVRADGHFGYGPVSSHADGPSNDQEDNSWEFRGVIGHDFIWDDMYSLSPYVGLGYRDLYNNARGGTGAGLAKGYRREDEYFYLPIGVNPGIRLNSNSRLMATVEFDYLLYGDTDSHLGDATSGTPEITFQDRQGYGFKTAVAWENGAWSVGPFFNVWEIENSKSKVAGGACTGGCIAPSNHTLEAGGQLKYRFDVF